MNDEKFLLHRVCPNKLLRSHFLSTGLKSRRTYGIVIIMQPIKPDTVPGSGLRFHLYPA